MRRTLLRIIREVNLYYLFDGKTILFFETFFMGNPSLRLSGVLNGFSYVGMDLLGLNQQVLMCLAQGHNAVT